jgi:hypothetical protein
LSHCRERKNAPGFWGCAPKEIFAYLQLLEVVGYINLSNQNNSNFLFVFFWNDFCFKHAIG